MYHIPNTLPWVKVHKSVQFIKSIKFASKLNPKIINFKKCFQTACFDAIYCTIFSIFIQLWLQPMSTPITKKTWHSGRVPFGTIINTTWKCKSNIPRIIFCFPLASSQNISLDFNFFSDFPLIWVSSRYIIFSLCVILCMYVWLTAD